MSSVADEVSIGGWIKARNAEIALLASECEKKLPQQMSQRLPRYMRRRAASGNPKRIPKSVRPWWLEEKPRVIKKRKAKVTSAGVAVRSRERRNQDPFRSCIHIWFAKRFKIHSIWNQKVAWSNNTKNQRSLFRKSKDNYVIYYLSNFMRCIRKPSATDADAPVNYTSPINFTHNGHQLMFVHVCETIDKPGEDASDLYQLVRLVGPKSRQIAHTMPADKCLLLSGQIDDSRAYVDVISTDGSFKQFIWPLLSKNKSHLVGGLRDWCMLHLNSGKPCFPFFGYPESAHATSFGSFCKKKKNPSHQKAASQIDALSSVIAKTNECAGRTVAVAVILTASARGTPVEGDEIIVTGEDGQQCIGFVQFGAYCLQSGRGKGIGVIYLSSSDLEKPTLPLSVEFKSKSTVQENSYNAMIQELIKR